jgi:hypothetical protein
LGELKALTATFLSDLLTMGMFDYVHINPSKLPISSGEQESLCGVTFQTKSLENVLADFYITAEGGLEVVYDLTDQLPEDGDVLEQTVEIQRKKLLDAQGIIRFHTTLNSTFYVFYALFDNGQLFSIIDGRPKSPVQKYKGDTCIWSLESAVAN